MKRKHEQKNDFFYSFVMFAMFAVVVFSVAAEFVDRHPEAFFVDTNEALEPREMVANVGDSSVASGRGSPSYSVERTRRFVASIWWASGRRADHLPR